MFEGLLGDIDQSDRLIHVRALQEGRQLWHSANDTDTGGELLAHLRTRERRLGKELYTHMNRHGHLAYADDGYIVHPRGIAVAVCHPAWSE